MDLLDLSISPSTAIVSSLVGDYTRDGGKGSSGSQFVFARPGGILDLYSCDGETGAMKMLSSTKTFSVIRSIDNFRVQGSKRDHVVIGKFEDGTCWKMSMLCQRIVASPLLPPQGPWAVEERRIAPAQRGGGGRTTRQQEGSDALWSTARRTDDVAEAALC